MKSQLHKSAIAALLLTVLLFSPFLRVSAQEMTEVPTETVLPTETVPATEPAETVPPTEAPTEPEETEMPVLAPDPSAAIYQICERLVSKMEARQLFVYHTGTGQMLYSKSVDTGKLYPASITKLFSAYVALQYLDPETVITAGDELDLVHEGSSLAYISRGSSLKVKMLVEGMMLPSGNDAAIVLATAAGRAIAGDSDLAPADAMNVFVDEMNRKADELGFEKTHFANPDGWHTGCHYTCLNDLARIATLALNNDTIRRYMKMGKDETHLLSGQYVIWENTNLLVNQEGGYYRSDAIGMKTGYTRPAGYCLMSAFTFEEGDIIIGLFGYVKKYERFSDAIDLIKAVKEQLRLEMISDESVG
jgi:D-alanyl-D-alanine carboxypeptidase (penicillin-binding protein 5/6)